MNKHSELSMIALLCSGFILGSCQNQQLNSSGTKSALLESESETQTEDEELVDDDKIVPPANIIGAYLNCSFEKEPSKELAEAIVGCRFDDQNGQRIPASKLGLNYSFSYIAPEQSDISIFVKDLTDDSRYDALYLFFASNPTSLLAAARQTVISVQIEGEFSSGQAIVISQPLGEVERDISSISEAPNNDYEELRDEILLEGQNEQVTPPI